MDSRRHKKAGYPLHMKGATDTFSFKPTVITYNEANIVKNLVCQTFGYCCTVG